MNKVSSSLAKRWRVFLSRWAWGPEAWAEGVSSQTPPQFDQPRHGDVALPAPISPGPPYPSLPVAGPAPPPPLRVRVTAGARGWSRAGPRRADTWGGRKRPRRRAWVCGWVCPWMGESNLGLLKGLHFLVLLIGPGKHEVLPTPGIPS